MRLEYQKTRHAGGLSFYKQSSTHSGKAFPASLIEAGNSHLDLRLREQAEDADRSRPIYINSAASRDFRKAVVRYFNQSF